MLREVKLLRELRSPNVVRLLDVFPHKRGISLVRQLALLPAAVALCHGSVAVSCQLALPSAHTSTTSPLLRVAAFPCKPPIHGVNTCTPCKTGTGVLRKRFRSSYPGS